ncbi:MULTISPECIES: hypothetical protein [Lactobacillaceae]|uniref:hypothetical protein n=1 Tax=Lactobacillaceae TaxID=33958 RepID=UPI001943EA9E|nr:MULTISPECIES: hypothetical protein [Lactobacillaceae]MDM5047631.1 hypothetical protein [Levilactobacillus brevis]
MADKPDIVQIKMDQPNTPARSAAAASKALQIKLADNQSVIVYNHIQGYILDALMKAVFNRAH